MKRQMNVSNKTFNAVADKIAQASGYKDHADALAHRGPDGKVPVQNPDRYKRADRFKRGSGCYTCSSCGKQTRETGLGESNCGPGLCAKCFEEAGLENEHLDGYHDDKPNKDCPMCRAAGAMQPDELGNAGAIASVDKYYDRSLKLWVVQRLDKDGNQIGEVDYEHDEDNAAQLRWKYQQQIVKKAVTCSQCGFSTDDKKQFAAHLEIHFKKEETKVENTGAGAPAPKYTWDWEDGVYKVREVDGLGKGVPMLLKECPTKEEAERVIKAWQGRDELAEDINTEIQPAIERLVEEIQPAFERLVDKYRDVLPEKEVLGSIIDSIKAHLPG